MSTGKKTKRGRGRPRLSAADAESRRVRWRRAMAFSGLSAPEAARLIGRSVATVWSYGSKNGSVPAEAAIALLEAHNRARAEDELVRLISSGARAGPVPRRPSLLDPEGEADVLRRCSSAVDKLLTAESVSPETAAKVARVDERTLYALLEKDMSLCSAGDAEALLEAVSSVSPDTWAEIRKARRKGIWI